MLLYHFPLISDYRNLGFAKLFKNDGNEWNPSVSNFASGGMIASTAKGVTAQLGTANLLDTYEQFTILARIFNSTSSAGGDIFVINVATTGKGDIDVQLNNSDVIRIGINNYTTSTFTWEISKTITKGWHSIAVTFDKGTAKFYVDNICEGTINDISYNRQYRFYGNNFIGNNNGTSHLMQDFRMYDYALSQAEINEYSRALVVHYPLQGNELNPSVLKDVSGFGNDYTLQGTNSYQLNSARGVKSLHTIDTAIYTQTPISSGYTTSFWCKYNGEWKHLCNNGSKYVNGVVNSSLYDTIYATLTASGYDIADYRVYATALSSEDIKNLYNSPISVSNQHQTMAFEFKENPLYPSKYWRTPTYAEMNYILNTRTNAANLRTLGRVEISSGTYVNGCFLLPDDWVLPAGVTMTIVTNNFTTNTYTLEQFKLIENGGGVFLPSTGIYNPSGAWNAAISQVFSGTVIGSSVYYIDFRSSGLSVSSNPSLYVHRAVRLCKIGSQFSTSATTKIDFAPANLQYHCTQHIWRFAEHSYDIIGEANANISDTYNGWIDLFGYGTSGVNYLPTLHTTTNADYASGDISNTDNDWGINEIQSYDYNARNFAANKNGIVQHNELRENDSDVNGCYNNKLITNELIEN